MKEEILELCKLSDKELKDLKQQREKELECVLDAIEHKKVMKSPYQYKIFAYNKGPKGKCKNLKEMNLVMERYFHQVRLGISLITGGFSYLTNVEGEKELLSYMFSKSGNGKLLDTIVKCLSIHYEIVDITYKDLFVEIVKDLFNDNLYLKEMNKDKIKKAIIQLGEELDKDKELVIDRLTKGGQELGDYKIMLYDSKYLLQYKN